MRVQSKLRTADPQPGIELQAWAEAVRRLSPARSQSDFDRDKAIIASAMERLAGQLRLTR